MKVVSIGMIYLAACYCFFLAWRDFGSEQGPTQWGFFALCAGGVLVLFPRLTRGKTPWVEWDMTLAASQPAPVESPSPSSSSSSSAAAEQYPYLPQSYGQTHSATDAEWRTLRLTAAHNAESYLTEKLVRTRLTAWLSPTYLDVMVGTRPQSTWDAYAGKGDFTCPDRELRAEYADAAANLMDAVRDYFPAISDQDVRIRFSILGHHVGTWQGGEMKLKGEKQPPDEQQ